MSLYWEYMAEIIKAASTSNLGIFALMIILVTLVAFYFFRKEKTAIKMFVFLLLFGGISSFGYMVYHVEPEVSVSPSRSNKGIVEKAQSLLDKVIPQSVKKEPERKATTAVAKAMTKSVKKPVRKRVDCGEHWTGWQNIGAAVGNPCPSGCQRGPEISQAYRAVGFPPRPQVKHKFKCWRWG